VVSELDDTIGQIRSSIFELRGVLGPQTGTLRSRILELVADLEPVLPSRPRVQLVGPIDSVVPDDAVDDITAVLREALTNVGKHARAEHIDVRVEAAGGRFTLEVADDGVGIGSTTRRSGLDNLAHRANNYGGSFEMETPAAEPGQKRKGTRLRWTIPLP
jgi:signal transduction histidine kinase